jgi:Domain of unknown function (DUF4124)
MARQGKRGTWAAGIAAIGYCWSAAVSGQAQTDTQIYKWVDKDGVVSYSQSKPVDPGAHDITTITVKGLPADRQRAAARMLANLEKLSDAETAAREKRLAAADKRIDAALQRLQSAEHELSAGAEPTGYDRVGNVGGHARLRDSYFERVAQLQAQVDQARQALDAAYAARDQSGE